MPWKFQQISHSIAVNGRINNTRFTTSTLQWAKFDDDEIDQGEKDPIALVVVAGLRALPAVQIYLIQCDDAAYMQQTQTDSAVVFSANNTTTLPMRSMRSN